MIDAEIRNALEPTLKPLRETVQVLDDEQMSYVLGDLTDAWAAAQLRKVANERDAQAV